MDKIKRGGGHWTGNEGILICCSDLTTITFELDNLNLVDLTTSPSNAP